jgi:hypothetical protein
MAILASRMSGTVNKLTTQESSLVWPGHATVAP